MALTQTQVSELYVAVFGRASEGEGNTYWATYETTELAATEMFTLDVVSDYFSVSNFTEEANVRTVVEAIYLNALGKAPADDVEGIQYWVDSIMVSGNTMGVMVAGLVASANDPVNAGAAQDTFNNKVAVSNYTADTVEAFSDFTTFQGLISSVDETTASVDAAKTEVDTLVIPVVDGETFSLTTDAAESVFGTDADDTFVATEDTYQTADVIADATTTDNDTLTLALTDDFDMSVATVVGVENAAITVAALATAGNTNELQVTGLSTIGAYSFDVDQVGTTIDTVVLAGAGTTSVTATDDFSAEVEVVTAVDDAELTVSSAAALTTHTSSTGTAAAFTATSTSATTATFDTDTDGTATVTTTAADAVVDAVAATTVVATSAGSIDADTNDLTAATSVTLTAADEVLVDVTAATAITVSAGGTTASDIDDTSGTTLATVNLSSNSAHTVNLQGAVAVDTVNISGDNDVTVEVDIDDVNALTDSQITVADTSTATSTLSIAAGTASADLSLADVDVIDVAFNANTSTLTVANNANVQISADQTALTVAAASGTTNTLSLTAADDEAAGQSAFTDITTTGFSTVTVTNAEVDEDEIGTNDAAAMLVTTSDFGDADVTLAGGIGGLTVGTSLDTTGDVTLTGSGDVDMSAGAITADSVDASALTGDLDIQLDGVATVDTVTAGSGDDTITLATAALTTGAYAIDAGAGADNITIIDADAAIDGGTGTDTVTVAATADLSDNTDFSLANIEIVDITTAGAATLTLSATQFATDNTFVLLGNSAGAADVLAVDGTAAADTIDASGVTVEIADVSLALDGAAGIDTITGSAEADSITGGDDADVLSGGAGNDTFEFDNVDDLAAGESIDGGEGTDILNFASGAATTIDLTTVDVTNVETLTVADAADIIVLEQGIGIETINGLADGTATTVTLVDGTTAYETTAEAAAADVDAAGEWFFVTAAAVSDAALTYYDEVASEAVTITLTGIDSTTGADTAAVIAGNLVVSVV